MPHTVLVSASSPAPADEVRDCAAAAGFTVQSHALGSAPGVNFAPIAAAIVDVGDQHELAATQTRRWRAELGDEHLPIVWLLPTFDAAIAARGLDAGADAVLSRPLDAALLQAQLRAAVRSRTAVSRIAARAAEARIVGDQLNRTFTQMDRELELTRRVRLALLQQAFPDVEGCRFAVCHRPRGRNGGDFYAVHRVAANRVVFLVGDVIGQNTAGGLLGKFLAEAVFAAGSATAGALLAEANLALLRLKLEDVPLVAMLVGVLNCGKPNPPAPFPAREWGAESSSPPALGEGPGEGFLLSVARAGLPAPVFVPANGEAESWAVPGPFLGVAETSFVSHSRSLKPGDKLLLATDGTRPDGDPGPSDDTRLLDAAKQHRTLSEQRFVDAVAADLLTHVRHDDDFTLLCVEMTGEPRPQGSG
jgi:DNA-binding response OmpR family regulator